MGAYNIAKQYLREVRVANANPFLTKVHNKHVHCALRIIGKNIRRGEITNIVLVPFNCRIDKNNTDVRS